MRSAKIRVHRNGRGSSAACWIEDESDPEQKFARKVDAPKVPEDLLEEFGK